MADEEKSVDLSGLDGKKEASPSTPHHEAKPHHPEGKKQAGDARMPSNSFKDSLISIYDNHYKPLLIIPLLVIIIAAVILFSSMSRTGSFFQKDISLSGGVTVTALTGFNDIVGLQSELDLKFPQSDISVRKLGQFGQTTGIIVEAGFESEAEISSLVSLLSQRLGIPEVDLTVQRMGASLGASFFDKLLKGMIFAFAFMALVIFIYFKVFSGKWLWLPGAFVVWTAFVDILSTLAVVSVSGIHLSAAGLAAFLMLIGYSVDTDILLTVRALGTEGTLSERVRSAARTGILMSMTAFVAVSAGYFLAESETIKQIMFILSVGMVFDIIHTWLTNASLLKWYLERKVA